MSLWSPLSCFVSTTNLFSQSLSIVLRCGGLLLNVFFSFSSTMCIQWPGFALIRLSCRCVNDVMLLHCVCCTRLIQTRISVCSVSFHLLLSEFDIPELWLHQLKFEVSRCRMSQFARCFLPSQTLVWNDLPYTVSDTGTLDGFTEQSIIGCVAVVLFSTYPRWQSNWGVTSQG